MFLKIRIRTMVRALLPAAPLLFMLAQAPVLAGGRPEALQALEAKGFTIVGTFPSAGGLSAWAAYAGQRPVALYETPDGKHLIAGTLLDAKGNDVNQRALEKVVAKPMSDAMWATMERSEWIADGSDKAPRVVYVFTDPNCPFCNRLWSDARPWVDAGKVQLRHLVVAVLTPTSAGKAAALFADKNPSAALAAHERANAVASGKAMAEGRVQAPGEQGLKPLASIPAAARARLDANEKLMSSLNLEATPGLVWRNASGAIQARPGAPASVLPAIFGPL